MRQITLVFTFIFVMNNIHAQFTLNSDNAPQAEYKYYFFKADLNNINGILIGQNIIWNMSSVIQLQDTLVKYYTTDTNYNSFPTHNYPSSYFDTSLYNLKSQEKLYKVTNNKYSLGYELVPVPVVVPQACPVNKVILHFPFSYNDSIEQNWHCGLINSAYRKIKAVGFGKLILSNVIYDTVLLIHTFERQEYSPSSQTPHVFYDTLYEDIFDWYSVDENMPVFSIHYQQKKHTQYGWTYFYYDTLTYIYKDKVYLNAIVEPNIDNQEIILYPNPSTGSFNVIFFAKTTGTYKVKLMDLYGKNVLVESDFFLNNGKNEIFINSGNIAQGFYILQLEFNSVILSNKKILIQ